MDCLELCSSVTGGVWSKGSTEDTKAESLRGPLKLIEKFSFR